MRERYKTSRFSIVPPRAEPQCNRSKSNYAATYLIVVDQSFMKHFIDDSEPNRSSGIKKISTIRVFGYRSGCRAASRHLEIRN